MIYDIISQPFGVLFSALYTVRHRLATESYETVGMPATNCYRDKARKDCCLLPGRQFAFALVDPHKTCG